MHKIMITFLFFIWLHNVDASDRRTSYKIKDHYQILTNASDNNIGFGLQQPSIIAQCIPGAGNEYSRSEIVFICDEIIYRYLQDTATTQKEFNALRSIAMKNKSKIIETIATRIDKMDIA